MMLPFSVLLRSMDRLLYEDGLSIREVLAMLILFAVSQSASKSIYIYIYICDLYTQANWFQNKCWFVICYKDQLHGEVITRIPYGVSFTHPASKSLFRSFRMGFRFGILCHPFTLANKHKTQQPRNITMDGSTNHKTKTQIPQLAKLTSCQPDH